MHRLLSKNSITLSDKSLSVFSHSSKNFKAKVLSIVLFISRLHNIITRITATPDFWLYMRVGIYMCRVGTNGLLNRVYSVWQPNSSLLFIFGRQMLAQSGMSLYWCMYVLWFLACVFVFNKLIR